MVVCKLHQKYILKKSAKDVHLEEFIYLVFICMPGENYRMWLRSLLLCLCDVFWWPVNSLACWFCPCTLGLTLFQIESRTVGHVNAVHCVLEMICKSKCYVCVCSSASKSESGQLQLFVGIITGREDVFCGSQSSAGSSCSLHPAVSAAAARVLPTQPGDRVEGVLRWRGLLISIPTLH